MVLLVAGASRRFTTASVSRFVSTLCPQGLQQGVFLWTRTKMPLRQGVAESGQKRLLISRSLVRSQPGSPSGRNRRKICRLYRERRTHTISSSCDGPPPISRPRIKTAKSAWNISARQALLCWGGNQANNPYSVTRAVRDVLLQHLCRRLCVLLHKTTLRLESRLIV